MFKTSFMRLIKKIATEYKVDLRFQKNAVLALQKTSKFMFVSFFERKLYIIYS